MRTAAYRSSRRNVRWRRRSRPRSGRRSWTSRVPRYSATCRRSAQPERSPTDLALQSQSFLGALSSSPRRSDRFTRSRLTDKTGRPICTNAMDPSPARAPPDRRSASGDGCCCRRCRPRRDPRRIEALPQHGDRDGIVVSPGQSADVPRVPICGDRDRGDPATPSGSTVEPQRNPAKSPRPPHVGVGWVRGREASATRDAGAVRAAS